MLSLAIQVPALAPTVAPMRGLAGSSVRMALSSMEGISVETGKKVFDPLGLGSMGGEETVKFFRHAELKHGRIAMAAIVGFQFHINDIHFSGYLSPTYGVTFEDLSNMGPLDAWNAIPLLGQMQIIFTIACLEHASESLNPAGHVSRTTLERGPAPSASHSFIACACECSTPRVASQVTTNS